jgi:hypothetical protein
VFKISTKLKFDHNLELRLKSSGPKKDSVEQTVRFLPQFNVSWSCTVDVSIFATRYSYVTLSWCTLTEEISSSVPSSNMYSGDHGISPGRGVEYTDIFRGFSQSLQINDDAAPQRGRIDPFIIRYSSLLWESLFRHVISLSFNVAAKKRR